MHIFSTFYQVTAKITHLKIFYKFSDLVEIANVHIPPVSVDRIFAIVKKKVKNTSCRIGHLDQNLLSFYLHIFFYSFYFAILWCFSFTLTWWHIKSSCSRHYSSNTPLGMFLWRLKYSALGCIIYVKWQYKLHTLQWAQH